MVWQYLDCLADGSIQGCKAAGESLSPSTSLDLWSTLHMVDESLEALDMEVDTGEGIGGQV